MAFDPTPNARAYANPDPHYLRSLLVAADMTQATAAGACGVSPRSMRSYLSTAEDHIDAPYAVQFCLEALARD